jgi:DNA/RNA endonuclease G (NUC1)
MANRSAKNKTKKKRSAQGKATPKSRNRPNHSHWLRKLLVRFSIAILAIGGIYYFSSFEIRAKMERIALSAINSSRTHGAMPTLVAPIFDSLYDAIPSSGGMVVEGGELGRDQETPFLAGMPNSRMPIRPLLQASYINLFNERSQQTACIAIRLDDTKRKKADTDGSLQIDARIPRLSPQTMTLGEWLPQPIAPAKALIGQYGERGAIDAKLATNYAPMTEAYTDGVWKKVMHEFTQRYPKRFGEVWVYLGPAYLPESSNFGSAISLPDAFYIIAFDLTDEGGLRALALLIPTDAESENLNDYLSSIAEIEKLAGLQFLPELDFSIRDTIGDYVSPTVW